MKPILFNTDMVRAILDGRKTVTRRVVKPQPVKRKFGDKEELAWVTPQIVPGYEAVGVEHTEYLKAPYHTGDILYVRETWTTVPDGSYVYKASVECPDAWEGTWHPSIHMPKEAARLFLRVTAVRVERLREITCEQAYKEGCTNPIRFDELWNTTIKPADLPLYGWEANPWVWVIEFERVSKEAALEGGPQ